MRTLALALFGTLLLTACGSNEPLQPQPVEKNMEISVDLREEHRCSRISPEIEIPHPPQGTRSYHVQLKDMETKRVHGGGSWTDADFLDGSVIAEGALTRYYMGPCPPNEESRVYQYVVNALDVNKQIVGVGKYTFLQE